MNINELAMDKNFLALANSYLDTVGMYNKLYDDVCNTWASDRSRLFNTALFTPPPDGREPTALPVHEQTDIMTM